MVEPSSFKNSLLIAMPSMTDASFRQSVIYIYQHDADGAFGIVMNKGLNLSLGELLKEVKFECNDPFINNQPTLYGGPIAQDQGFTLYSKDGESIVISPAKEILHEIMAGRAPRHWAIILGFAGWTKGQLEAEIRHNCWLSAPMNMEILFDIPLEKRWQAAAASIGVDLKWLSSEVGHA
jgi:putative transcriptional regulator